MKRNHRLMFAVGLCLELGIDDPIAWFNACPPGVLDLWIAHSWAKDELKAGKGEMMKPEDALAQLMVKHG